MGIKRKLSLIQKLAALLCLVLLSACSPGWNTPDNRENKLEINAITQTPNQGSIASPTATLPLPLPTQTVDLRKESDMPILSTQGPVVVVTSKPEETEYLYKDAIVTVQLEEHVVDNAYLNLDDLSNNSIENSDIQFIRYIGTEMTYEIYPANIAYYFVAYKSNVSFSFCKDYLLNIDMDQYFYSDKAHSFDFSNSYCVLTTEGRVAIMNYVEDSKKFVGEWPQEVLSVKITVFNEIIE